jgi:hypothetical protein
MSRYKDIVTLVPEGKRGVAEVIHFDINEKDVARSRLRALFGHWSELVTAGKFARLEVRGSLVMSDTQFERDSNQLLLYHATGDVLVFGLGLGLVLPPILEKSTVRSVTVIEKEPDVIHLVAPHHQDIRLRIECGDAWDWTPARGKKYDTIYFDIWGDIVRYQMLNQIRELRRRARPWKRTGGWIGAWLYEELKNDAI